MGVERALPSDRPGTAASPTSRPGSVLIWFLWGLVFVPLTDNFATYCPVLPWTQANVESETSNWRLENIQIFQLSMGVQAFQLSPEPWDQSRRNKANCWRTMEGTIGIGGYCPPSTIIVRNRRAFRRPSFPVIERNIEGLKNRWSRSVVSNSHFHFIIHERVAPTHVELKHSQSRYSCTPTDICGLFQNLGLLAHVIGLSANLNESKKTYSDAKSTNESQAEIDPKRRLIVKVLLWGINDLYVGVNILLLFTVEICAVCRFYDNRRDWLGWVLVALFSLNLIRTAIGAEYDQQHPEYRQSFPHDSAIVRPVDFKLGHYPQSRVLDSLEPPTQPRGCCPQAARLLLGLA